MEMTATQSEQWYKDAIIYELHVRAFYDSNGDGIGDFRGLIQKLDYLEDLGITAIWLLPFYPSPLKDDGYDIANYTDVHPMYGSLADFKLFVREAHRRGIRVITELVLNHTSDQHPWFQRARRSPRGSRWRDFYVWSDDPQKFPETRIIFKDFEASNWSWDPVAGQYYWHRFYHHQPDLNYDNVLVRRAMLQVMEFWLKLGVDGLRLDAVPYLYEREGTNNENLPETHNFLRILRRYVDQKFPGRMLLAEANQWPEDAIAYFGMGDECHMAFHFPLMPRLFMALRMEDRFPVVEILKQTPSIPESCQWALFLRNHDELTLEMVTDEERDFMYRVYSPDPQARINLGIRRRLAPLLGNNRRRIEVMNGLLFSLPGTPIIYYGDEIGMGDNIYLGDRNGVRTPMQWSGDRNAGFSRANPQRLYLPVIIDPPYHYEAVNVEAQESNPHSLLWWMKRLIALRKRYPVMGRGSMEILYPPNRRIFAFLRRYEDQTVLVVVNLSRFLQPVELDLSAFKGAMLKEIFGQTLFPPLGEKPYFMTVAPHSFYWFEVVRPEVTVTPTEAVKAPVIPEVLWEGNDFPFGNGKTDDAFQEAFSRYLRSARWFAGKGKTIQRLTIDEAVPVESREGKYYLLLLNVLYTEGEPELYLIPVRFERREEGSQLGEGRCVVCAVKSLKPGGGEWLVVEATEDPNLGKTLLETIRSRHYYRGRLGGIYGVKGSLMKKSPLAKGGEVEISPMSVEQSNSSLNLGNTGMMKIYRKLDWGVNPELELTRYLTEISPYPHIPHLLGSLIYERPGQGEITLGVLLEYVHHEGDGAKMSVEYLERVFDELLAERPQLPFESKGVWFFSLLGQDPPRMVVEYFVGYLHLARRMGLRTGELHLALASAPDDPEFSPEPMGELYLRSVVHGMLSTLNDTMLTLRANLSQFRPEVRSLAERVIDYEKWLEDRFTRLRSMSINAVRTRVHGDFHLGQLLCRGDDFIIIDFEGEPMRTVTSRRIKRSPLKDVAGLLRSFQYAWEIALERYSKHKGDLAAQEKRYLADWARIWELWSSVAFFSEYQKVTEGTSIIPTPHTAAESFLEALLLDRCIYEIHYELQNRPDWLAIPLRGLLSLIRAPSD